MPPAPPTAALEAAVLASASAVEAALDAKLAALDNVDDADLATVRARRLAEMKRDADDRAAWLAAGHGRVVSVRGDKEFFDAARGVDRVVALFWRASRPCEAMQGLVRALAPRHVETKFIEIEAESAPFLADRLKVWMLPTLALLIDGKQADAVVGFDGLPGGDRATPAALEARLAQAGVVREAGLAAPRATVPGVGARRATVRRVARADSDEDSDFD